MKPAPMLTSVLAVAAVLVATGGRATDKPTFHYDAARTGANPHETRLTVAAITSGRFGPIWESAAFDRAPNGALPRLFASPLYLAGAAFPTASHPTRRLSAAFAVTTAGYAYAINAAPAGRLRAGAILWRRKLAEDPCGDGMVGNLSTPVIDRARGRIYVTACSGKWDWAVHALDLGTGAELPGWPVRIDAAGINRPGTNRNGTTRWVDGQIYYQRGALNLNRDGTRLYVAFGPDPQGWLVSLDTTARRLAGAFSTTPVQEEEQGGMWGASGASVDGDGRIHIPTGANFGYTLAHRGIPGVFPDSAHSWGQSILQFRDDGPDGLRLTGTYTPYNYCQTAASDIDIGGSGAVLFDLPLAAGSTRRLLALGGGKQGNAYLLDRDFLPGGTVRRHGCSADPATDRSLLAPEAQPALGARGPVNVFGPFSDSIGMTNQAKSRSTLAWWHQRTGRDWLFLTGSAKTGADYSINVPPGLVRVRVVSGEGDHPFLRIDGSEMTQTLQNPGSPVVSSNRGRNAIVWVLDPNALRSVDLFQPAAPGAMLYAFDARTLRVLWKSGAALHTTGKYNEPAVVDGMVLVGTDRLQAFGLRSGLPKPGETGGAQAAAPVRQGMPGDADRPATTGATVFSARCSACHSTGAGGAPALAALRQMPRARIVEALKTGKMAGVAGDLAPAEVEAVASFLSGER
jgi:outer membrane protein assembly factor BamB